MRSSHAGVPRRRQSAACQTPAFAFFVVQDPDAVSKEPRQFTPEVRVMAGARPMHAELFSICVLLDARPGCGLQGTRPIRAGG
jgi:hypothetical protein